MTSIEQPEFGRRLRQLRVARGLSQRDVAVGMVNPSYISLLESGSRVPALEVALHIARALGVPLTDLVDDVPPLLDSEPIRQESAASRNGGSGSIKQNDGHRLVQVLIARSAIDSGCIPEARSRVEQAYRSASTAGMTVLALEYGISLEEILVRQSDHLARYALMTELAELARATGVPELVLRVRIDQARAARDTGRFAEALEQAEAAAREIDNTVFKGGPEHIRLLSVLISIRCDSGETFGVSRLIKEMLEVATSAGSPALLGRAHWTASVALSRLGDAAGAVRHVRLANEILSHPETPLREWSRFSRSAASALLDADAPLEEVERHLAGARAALAAADLPGEASMLASLEVRYALATGDPERALLLADKVDEKSLTGFGLVRFRVAKSRALRAVGQPKEAATELRLAALLAEDLSAFQLAARLWRELSEMR
ncbi:MAG TPA: helix-turn-helix transcriptional regulator [Micromonospora sp.]